MVAKKPAKKKAPAKNMTPAKAGKKPAARMDKSSTKKAPGSKGMPYQGPTPQAGNGGPQGGSY
jgi:hypothetical protein